MRLQLTGLEPSELKGSSLTFVVKRLEDMRAKGSELTTAVDDGRMDIDDLVLHLNYSFFLIAVYQQIAEELRISIEEVDSEGASSVAITCMSEVLELDVDNLVDELDRVASLVRECAPSVFPH